MPQLEKPLDARLAEICDLLRQAGAGSFQLEAATLECGGDGSLGAGWSLVGGHDTDQRRAAAALAGRLYRAEAEIDSLSGEIIERYEEATLTHRLSQQLAGVHGDSPIARLVLAEVCRTLSASAGELWLRGERSVAPAALWPPDEGFSEDLFEQGPLIALEEGRPWLREASAGAQTVVAVPLPGSLDEPIGVLVLRRDPHERSFRNGNVKVLAAVACLASAFIRNGRLTEQARRAQADAWPSDLERQLRERLQPACELRSAAVEVAGGGRMAEGIVGNCCVCRRLPDASLVLIMADRRARGLTAALDLVMLTGALEAGARRASSPAEALRHANEVLACAPAAVVASAFVARFHAAGRQVEYASAAHPPVALITADGVVQQLDRHGPPLGVHDPGTYHDETLSLSQGDVLLAYSESVVDARDAAGRRFTFDRLAAAASRCRHADARTIRTRVLEEVVHHCGGDDAQHDMTLVVVRALPGAGALAEEAAA